MRPTDGNRSRIEYYVRTRFGLDVSPSTVGKVTLGALLALPQRETSPKVLRSMAAAAAMYAQTVQATDQEQARCTPPLKAA